MRMKLVLGLMILSLCVSANGAIENVKASLHADVDAVKPGESFTLGVLLKLQPHWHTYWINPGDTGNPAEIHLRGPAGFEFGAIQWPLPKKIDADGGIVFGYENEVLFMVPVKVAKSVAASGTANIDADIKWLCCKETCVEGGAKLAITLPVSLDSKPANAAMFDHWKRNLPVKSDQLVVAEYLGKIDAAQADQSPKLEFNIQWKKAPKKVEWFPMSTEAATIENPVLKHEGLRTAISYKCTVYKPSAVPNGLVNSLVVFEDEKGQRHGFEVPVKSK